MFYEVDKKFREGKRELGIQRFNKQRQKDRTEYEIREREQKYAKEWE
jgi:hypothetical protein